MHKNVNILHKYANIHFESKSAQKKGEIEQNTMKKSTFPLVCENVLFLLDIEVDNILKGLATNNHSVLSVLDHNDRGAGELVVIRCH